MAEAGALEARRRAAQTAPAAASPRPVAGRGDQHRGRAYVVIVNFGDPSDTLECLETLFRMDYPDFRVVVCDNAATATSFDALRAWADGARQAIAAGVTGRCLLPAPVQKPIPYEVLTAEAVIDGQLDPEAHASLVFVRSPTNRGFAGGCNLGLRYAMADREAAWFWLLNNDTAVMPDALTALVAHSADRPEIGLCGSTLIYYDAPDRLQALGGGRYDPWLGRMHLLGFQQKPGPGMAAAPDDLDFVHGASMLVRRSFVETVGLMDEDYFLYFEELDWTARAAGRYALGHAPGSVVFHKEGASAGSTTREPARRSRTSDYHGLRSRLLYTRRHKPWALPTVWLGLWAVLANRIRRSQWDRVPMILSLMAGRT